MTVDDACQIMHDNYEERETDGSTRAVLAMRRAVAAAMTAVEQWAATVPVVTEPEPTPK